MYVYIIMLGTGELEDAHWSFKCGVSHTGEILLSLIPRSLNTNVNGKLTKGLLESHIKQVPFMQGMRLNNQLQYVPDPDQTEYKADEISCDMMLVNGA